MSPLRQVPPESQHAIVVVGVDTKEVDPDIIRNPRILVIGGVNDAYRIRQRRNSIRKVFIADRLSREDRLRIERAVEEIRPLVSHHITTARIATETDVDALLDMEIRQREREEAGDGSGAEPAAFSPSTRPSRPEPVVGTASTSEPEPSVPRAMSSPAEHAGAENGNGRPDVQPSLAVRLRGLQGRLIGIMRELESLCVEAEHSENAKRTLEGVRSLIDSM